MILQAGAFHKPKNNPDADFMQLTGSPDMLVQEALKHPMQFRLVRSHNLIDGSPHMLEFEAVLDIDPEPKQEAQNEVNH
jgi:hypothetical protein